MSCSTQLSMKFFLLKIVSVINDLLWSVGPVLYKKKKNEEEEMSMKIVFWCQVSNQKTNDPLGSSTEPLICYL